MKISMMLLFLAAMWCVWPAAAQQAQQAQPLPLPDAPPQFQDGDVVCFLGDSITHSRKFHPYIYSFYLTRFPDRKIRFVNAGIAGDSAGGALRRLDWDVLPMNANIVSIMLGMNDVGRNNYGQANPSEHIVQARAQSLKNYRDNMTKLVETLIEKWHPKFIFVTPSPYDQTAQLATENFFGVNDALAQCAAIVKELAQRTDSGVVDFHAPITALNLERQKTDPAWTIVGTDRVHPGDVGQLVMAYLYLKAQRVPALISDFVVDVPTARVVKSENGEITALKVSPQQIIFDGLERALPFPVEDAAREALSLVPIETELNQQRLAVNVAGDATYRLTVDGRPIGDFSAAQLCAGVNLAFNKQMPQYKQAQEVQSLNLRRHALEVRLRSVAQIQTMLNGAKVDSNDEAAVQKYFSEFVEKLKASNSPQTAYFQSQFNNYTKTKPETGAVKAQIEELVQTLWKLNQPVPHHYELTRIEAKP